MRLAKMIPLGSLRLRSLVFQLHRYLELVCGLILVIIGITGSLLVFEPELEHQWIEQQIGSVVPQGNPVSIDDILATAFALSREAQSFVG